jgi:hypothetical protein
VADEMMAEEHAGEGRFEVWGLELIGYGFTELCRHLEFGMVTPATQRNAIRSKAKQGKAKAASVTTT